MTCFFDMLIFLSVSYEALSLYTRGGKRNKTKEAFGR
ncbi:BH3398 [Halalkalibacterium halodurans C-125]|uniref:BH3398 protein n=1 Tax=Halalkalibacterium halodurans (strain ATCC BAA-125 / DSM 18197 / FERM 7344 / JCM 9153 / C-125) TaxID=272558 RepID=Q9K7G3_HALH5|nr:BH3398 [Halalkalibacterium halodurans C-125]